MSRAKPARRVVEARAYAKVNLCLAVAAPEPSGPRAGWHRIASWFAPVELWDDVRVRQAGGERDITVTKPFLGHADASDPSGRLVHPLAFKASQYRRDWAPDAPRPTPIDWPEEKDLAVRAHRVLERDWHRLPLPVVLELSKRIPTGGGLGGGSSDAASVLRAVTRLYGLPLPGAALRRFAARLGSDVAYFIPGDWTGEDGSSLSAPPGPAVVRGFGDEIQSSAAVQGPITLILPEFGCPTPAVYRAFDALAAREFREGEVCRLASPDRGVLESSGALGEGLFNDLTEAAMAVEPRLHDVMERLRAAGHRPHLSGSGSTVFVLGEAEVAPPLGCVALRTRFASDRGT